MSDLWGVYERDDGIEGEKVEVTLQATPQHRGRYERKGFVFKRYLPGYGYGPAVGVSDPRNRAATAVFGERPAEIEDVDASQVVKEAMEVALRKVTGTWTDAEQLAAYEQHKEGKLLPEESAEMLSGDDPTKGYEEIAPKLVSGELTTPLQQAQAALGPTYAGAPPTQAVSPDGGKPVSTAGTDGAGRDGAGTPAARPPR
jgi:hypothetical protein